MVRTRVKYQEETVYARVKFKISDQALNDLNRELNSMVSQRACESCSNQENSNALDLIYNCCSYKETFIQSHMPTMEAIFRIIISNGNKPTTISHIYETLQDKWVDPNNMWLPTPTKLYRMLTNDMYYGIKEVIRNRTKRHQISTESSLSLN
jgi:hypothetical protein|tara:strand:+ start:1326 stop:1781 length:456 start_codon:yes stop_codon:yes gene_type:complete